MTAARLSVLLRLAQRAPVLESVTAHAAGDSRYEAVRRKVVGDDLVVMANIGAIHPLTASSPTITCGGAVR